MTEKQQKNYDLEQRLIAFAVQVIGIVDTTPNSKAGNHLSAQLVRSATAPALMYGEAQAAESRKDFVHKMKMALKELRETFNCLRMLHSAKLFAQEEKMVNAKGEVNELISIFVKSIETAERNMGEDDK